MNLGKKITLLFFTVLALANAVINFTCFRIGYVFIDHETFTGFGYVLWGIMVVVAAYLLFCTLYFGKKSSMPKIATVFAGIACGLSPFFLLVNYVSSTIVIEEATGILLINALPYIISLVAVPVILFALPKLEAKKRNAIAGVICSVFFACMLMSAFNLFPVGFKFESNPLVLDVGDGTYSVVFATTADSVGYVSYTYQGQKYTVYSEDDGNKKVSKIHSARVPREHLENNAYFVGAQRVYDAIPYGGLVGKKSITTPTFDFQGDRTKENLKIYTFSDWHDHIEVAEAAASYMESPDLLLMLGDYGDYYIDELQIVRNVIAGGAALTKSVVPAIFSKGNHEARSDGMFQIWRELGFQRMYYQVIRGDYRFTVLDSGENDPDEYYEFGDLNAYRQYLSIETDWLESLDNDEADEYYDIVISHATHFPTYNDLRARFEQKMIDMKTQLVVGGHSHQLRLNRSRYNNYYTFEDGGQSGSTGTKILNAVLNVATFKTPFWEAETWKNFAPGKLTHVGSYITFNDTDDSLLFRAYNSDGELAMWKTVEKYPVPRDVENEGCCDDCDHIDGYECREDCPCGPPGEDRFDEGKNPNPPPEVEEEPGDGEETAPGCCGEDAPNLGCQVPIVADCGEDGSCSECSEDVNCGDLEDSEPCGAEDCDYCNGDPDPMPPVPGQCCDDLEEGCTDEDNCTLPDCDMQGNDDEDEE
ncbi:MAG: metallophosphoesterase [Clostridiales bacterium]|jgi:predicted phosphodiesterase|nr:metallophosphoesterase [Clostridiales bacterium]